MGYFEPEPYIEQIEHEQIAIEPSEHERRQGSNTQTEAEAQRVEQDFAHVSVPPPGTFDSRLPMGRELVGESAGRQTSACTVAVRA